MQTSQMILKHSTHYSKVYLCDSVPPLIITEGNIIFSRKHLALMKKQIQLGVECLTALQWLKSR